MNDIAKPFTEYAIIVEVNTFCVNVMNFNEILLTLTRTMLR